MMGEGAVMIIMALQLADYRWSHRRFIVTELFCALTVETRRLTARIISGSFVTKIRWFL